MHTPQLHRWGRLLSLQTCAPGAQAFICKESFGDVIMALQTETDRELLQNAQPARDKNKQPGSKNCLHLQRSFVSEP